MNMENIITMDNDDLLGYFPGLYKYFKATLDLHIQQGNDDEFFDMLDNLKELAHYHNSNKLLRVSNNNGMGFTIKEMEIE